jgi:CheY-like chemotaxis protein
MLFSSQWEHANRPSSRRRSGGGVPVTVLLVGDARPRAAYRGILSQGHYEIFDASDAEEGLVLARKLRPGIVMVELTMPGRDGWEANRMLKSDPDTYLIPVVATSLSTLPPGTYHRARSAGFVDYVSRPIERRHVLEVVSTWSRPPAAVVV